MCSSTTARVATNPVRTVARSVNSGAATSGAAEKKGEPVKLGGVSTSNRRPTTIRVAGSALMIRRTTVLPATAPNTRSTLPRRPSPATLLSCRPVPRTGAGRRLAPQGWPQEAPYGDPDGTVRVMGR